MLTVRKARLDEAQAIIDLHGDTVRRINIRDYPPQQIEAWLGVRRVEVTEGYIRQGEFWVCTDANEKIVGIGFLRGNEICGLYVSADRQGQGIGSLLLATMEREAIDNGATELVLTSTLTALSFYEAKGYGHLERVTVGKARLDAVRMSKAIGHREQ